MSTTELAKIAATGARFRASYLVQQAGYTLALASTEGAALAPLLPKGHVEKTVQLRDDVDRALQDKTVCAAEAKHATDLQNEQMQMASGWIRGSGKRCQNAVHLGVPLPPEMLRTSSATSVPGMLEQMNRVLALLGEQSAAMDAVGPPTQPLIDEGRKLLHGLQQADSSQEQARALDLPASVTAFLIKKGELYLALKIINNAGHELYARDLASAAKFNMTILNRRGPSSGQPDPKPVPPVAKPA